MDLHYTFTWYTCRVFILFLNNRWIMNHNRWPGGHTGPHVGPGKSPQKLLAFQHLNELLVHVFLPIFTYFCIHFYMHNSIIMCQRDSTKNYKKKSSTCTPRCLKQVRSAPCGRIELGHVKQENPSTKRHIKTTVKNNTRLTKTR